ncbi:hypothetical protein D3C85_1288900 [compost metagenome]
MQVGPQRRGKALQQLAPFWLQLVRIHREQHVPANADAPVHERHAARRKRPGERLLERLAPLHLLLPLLDLGFEPGRQLHLEADHPKQDQHEAAQQHGHQVAKDGPDRRG